MNDKPRIGMMVNISALVVALFLLSVGGLEGAEGEDRFHDHGVVVPTAASRGTAATADDTGHISHLYSYRVA